MIFSSSGDSEYSPTQENMKAAKDLINELNMRGCDTMIIECSTLIHSKEKKNLEVALKRLKEVVQKT